MTGDPDVILRGACKVGFSVTSPSQGTGPGEVPHHPVFMETPGRFLVLLKKPEKAFSAE
jgi:hypothetical protein